MAGELSQREGSGVVHRILDAVADHSGTDPVDLPPLYRVLDTEALAVFLESSDPESTRCDRTVEFRYYGYHVTVTDTDHVDIQPVDSARGSRFRRRP